MSVNRGKQFEDVIREAFEKLPDVSIDRLHDQTNGYRGSQNICDFIVYREPTEYYIECKTTHGNTLPFKNITDTQWNGLLEKSKIKGVVAGIICWWVKKDVTFFLPIECLQILKEQYGEKSICYKDCLEDDAFVEIKGKKKRVFFDYQMREFLDEIQYIR